MPQDNKKDYQGGKAYGQLKQKREEGFQEINQEFLVDKDYDDIEDLAEKLEEYKGKFVEYDMDNSGDLGIRDVTYMMEKLGQAKTHLEIKKMIAEVDQSNTGAISYREFLLMLLGKRNSILKLILMFEQKKIEAERPKGPPPKRSLADLGIDKNADDSVGT